LEANSFVIPCNLREPIKLTTINDSHVGSANCAKDLLERKVKEIAYDDSLYWSGIGDYAEWIVPSDPRFDPDDIDPELVTIENLKSLRTVYVEYLTELFWPIRHKCVSFGEGNHEERYSSHNDGKMAYELAHNLGIDDRFTGWAGFTNLMFKDGNKHADSFMVYTSHGYQGGRKGGSLVNGLTDLMGFVEADIYLQGHSHQYISKYHVTLYSEDEHIRHRTKVGWHCGSFLCTYAQGKVSYAERKQYPPTVLGTPTVTIHPSREGHGHVE